jgi:hypothetical protein
MEVPQQGPLVFVLGPGLKDNNSLVGRGGGGALFLSKRPFRKT